MISQSTNPDTRVSSMKNISSRGIAMSISGQLGGSHLQLYRQARATAPHASIRPQQLDQPGLIRRSLRACQRSQELPQQAITFPAHGEHAAGKAQQHNHCST